jgi:hypothetical protein
MISSMEKFFQSKHLGHSLNYSFQSDFIPPEVDFQFLVDICFSLVSQQVDQDEDMNSRQMTQK